MNSKNIAKDLHASLRSWPKTVGQVGLEIKCRKVLGRLAQIEKLNLLKC